MNHPISDANVVSSYFSVRSLNAPNLWLRIHAVPPVRWIGTTLPFIRSPGTHSWTSFSAGLPFCFTGWKNSFRGPSANAESRGSQLRGGDNRWASLLKTFPMHCVMSLIDQEHSRRNLFN